MCCTACRLITMIDNESVAMQSSVCSVSVPPELLFVGKHLTSKGNTLLEYHLTVVYIATHAEYIVKCINLRKT